MRLLCGGLTTTSSTSSYSTDESCKARRARSVCVRQERQQQQHGQRGHLLREPRVVAQAPDAPGQIPPDVSKQRRRTVSSSALCRLFSSYFSFLHNDSPRAHTLRSQVPGIRLRDRYLHNILRARVVLQQVQRQEGRSSLRATFYVVLVPGCSPLKRTAPPGRL